MKKLIVIIILVLAILGGAAYYRVNELRNQPEIKGIDEIQQDNGLPVRIFECQTESVDDTFLASGTIEPIQTVAIAAEVPGRVEQIQVKVGQPVKQGDLLITLDTTTALLSLRQAEESLRQAEQALTKLENGSRPEEIELARAQMEQARADLDLKKLEKERFSKLFEEEAATLQMKQQTEAACHAAQALFDAAQASYQLARSGPRAEDIELAKIAVDQAKTALAQARDHLEDFYLKAPFDGVIAQKMTEVGDIADFKQTLFRLMRIGRVYSDVDVSELYIGKVNIGMPVKVRADALPGETFVGKVSEINPASTGPGRSYLTRIEIDNRSGRLRQGMFARAEFVMDHIENVFLLPDDAVRDERGQSYVLAISEQNVVEKVDVKTGRMIGDRIIVESGITTGMKVVVMGMNIEPGRKVTIVE